MEYHGSDTVVAKSDIGVQIEIADEPMEHISRGQKNLEASISDEDYQKFQG